MDPNIILIALLALPVILLMVLRVNAALEEKPELINEDCWGQGWMIAIGRT